MITDDKALAEQIGAVLIEARRYSSFVSDTGQEFHELVRRHLRTMGKSCPDSTTPDRVENIYNLASASFREAAFEAYCYEKYLGIWLGNIIPRHQTPNEIISLIHYFGNKVPLSLYTYFMYLRSVEFSSAFPRAKNILENFNEYFPKVDYARHAVAHEHDRKLGKSVLKNKHVLFPLSFNLSSITGGGYTFMDANGDTFELKFELARLFRFWDQFVEFVRSECV